MGNKYDKAFSYSCGREHKRKSKELDPQRTLYERVGKESACKQEREREHTKDNIFKHKTCRKGLHLKCCIINISNILSSRIQNSLIYKHHENLSKYWESGIEGLSYSNRIKCYST